MERGHGMRDNPAMPESARPLVYSEIEIRSYLPSGWGIRPGASGVWNPRARTWSIEVYDGADNVWPVAVPASEATRQGRLDALRAGIDTVARKSLGRKSVITG